MAADDKMNRREFATRCKSLHEQVNALLQQEEMPIQLQVLLSNFFVTTEGIPCQQWAPMLAAFLGVLAHRDGLYFNSMLLDDDDEEGGCSEETMH